MTKEETNGWLEAFEAEYRRAESLTREGQRYETVRQAADKAASVGLRALLAMMNLWRVDEANPAVAASESRYIVGTGNGPMAAKDRGLSMMYAVKALLIHFQKQGNPSEDKTAGLIRSFDDWYKRTKKMEREKQRYETIAEAAGLAVADGLQALMQLVKIWERENAGLAVAASEGRYSLSLTTAGSLAAKERSLATMYAVKALLLYWRANRE